VEQLLSRKKKQSRISNRKLREELSKVSDKVIQLENENSALRKKLDGIEMIKDARMKDSCFLYEN